MMSRVVELSPDWRDWIALNRGRGCTAESMIDAMVRGGVDRASAAAAVGAVSGAGSTPEARAAQPTDNAQATRGEYVYESPRLAPGNLIHACDRDIQVLLRVRQPGVAVLGNVLSHDECDELIRRSRDKLKRSTTVDPATGAFAVIANRSSEGAYFTINADPFIARLDRRVSALMNFPVDHGEGLQILHYNGGGEYRPHFDYFPPDDPGSAMQMKVGGQRVSTLVMYLNDVEAGGATVFPKLGLEVCPTKGSAVYFEYTNSQGQIDPMTLHAGAPVTRGEKWIVTKWMRQRSYGAVPEAPTDEAIAAQAR